MNSEMQKEKKQNVDGPRFYQNGFFHLLVILILSLPAIFSFNLILLAADFLLLVEIILIGWSKIYAFKNGEWKVSIGWMCGTISFVIVVLGISVLLIGGVL